MNHVDAVRDARKDTVPTGGAPLFPEFFLGGFECSCHLLADRRRLDLTAATGHDALAELDGPGVTQTSARGERSR